MTFGATVFLAGAFTLLRWAIHVRAPRFASALGIGVLVWGGFHWLVHPFVVGTYRVDSGSMRPTLLPGDIIVVGKLPLVFRSPARGDIVVLASPEGDRVVKRVVGLPGDLVELRRGDLFVNGAHVPEPYVSHPAPESFKLVAFGGGPIPVTSHGEEVNSPRLVAERFVAASAAGRDALRRSPPVPVPSGCWLVLGDQRAGSSDSRRWGVVQRRALVGTAKAVVLPLSRWSRF